MKKMAKPTKLVVAKETVRELAAAELAAAAGGKTATCLCGSCGNPHSTCPV